MPTSKPDPVTLAEVLDEDLRACAPAPGAQWPETFTEFLLVQLIREVKLLRRERE